MATCVTCGEELHPERAELYDYCTKPACRHANAQELPIVAIGVNKASDQFAVLDERTKDEAATGRFKREPDAAGSKTRRSGVAATRGSAEVRELVPHSFVRPSGPRWSPAQGRLALTYRAMGMNRDQIASRLGVSPYLVSQILAEASARGRR